MKHELLLKRETASKADAWLLVLQVFLLQAINEDRGAYFCGSLSLVLSFALPDIIVHLNFCTRIQARGSLDSVFSFFFFFFELTIHLLFSVINMRGRFVDTFVWNVMCAISHAVLRVG